MHSGHSWTRQLWWTGFSLVLSCACAEPAVAPRGDPPPVDSSPIDSRPALEHYFSDAGTRGTMVIRGLTSGRPVTINAERAERGFAPSSTFKIPNALIAFEEGLVSSPDDVFKGPHAQFLLDGKPLLPKACDGDITLRAAFRNSCIPVFQEIAGKVPQERYRRYLQAWRYGNMQIGGAERDRFWLEGDLKISALQQADFLERLTRGELQGARDHLRHVQDLTTVERTHDYVLHAKTGYVFTASPAVGWYVGWVERRDRTVVFALNLDLVRPELAAARATIARQILAELDVL